MQKESSSKRNIALFMAGQAITLFGSMLVHYAVMWHITLQAQSGWMMTLISMVLAVPMFIISPFAGVWADRYNKKNIINIADASIAIITLALAVIFSLGMESVVLLFVCMVARAFGQGIQNPTVNSLIPEIVPQENLTRINGLNSSVQSVVAFAAPAAGGVLLSIAPLHAIMYIDVITAIIGIGILLFFVKTPKKNSVSVKKSAFGDMKDGLKYIKGHPFVKAFIFASILFQVLVGPMALLTLLHVVRKFGEEPWRLAAQELAFFIGMTLGGIFIAAWGGFKNKVKTIIAALVFQGVCSIAIGIFSNFWMYLTAMLAIGVAVPAFDAPIAALLQSKVEPEFIWRVFAVMTMIQSVAMPAGMLIWGPLADKVSIGMLLISSGIGMLGISVLFICNKEIRKAGVPETAPGTERN